MLLLTMLVVVVVVVVVVVSFALLWSLFSLLPILLSASGFRRGGALEGKTTTLHS